MALGVKIAIERADPLALRWQAAIQAVARRCAIVGSVRRRRPIVGDVELLIEPEMIAADLFGAMTPDLEPLRQLAAGWGEITRAGDRMIEVSNVPELDGRKVELYIVWPPANWYCLLAIRTGPADLSRQAVSLMPARGFYHRDGRIVRSDGSEVPIDSERAFFDAAGLPFFPPHLRDERAALVPPTKP